VLHIEEEHAENLVLQRTDLHAQIVLHDFGCRHDDATSHALPQKTPRLMQDLPLARGAVLPVGFTHEQCVGSGSVARRSERLRHMNSGLCIGRDCPRPEHHVAAQPSGFEDGRRPQALECERADLDGENDVVAWVDTASPIPRTPPNVSTISPACRLMVSNSADAQRCNAQIAVGSINTMHCGRGNAHFAELGERPSAQGRRTLLIDSLTLRCRSQFGSQGARAGSQRVRSVGAENRNDGLGQLADVEQD
jgi:hypothetical protein